MHTMDLFINKLSHKRQKTLYPPITQNIHQSVSKAKQRDAPSGRVFIEPKYGLIKFSLAANFF